MDSKSDFWRGFLAWAFPPSHLHICQQKFRLCPKNKATGVLNVKHFFKARPFISQIKLKITVTVVCEVFSKSYFPSCRYFSQCNMQVKNRAPEKKY